MNILSDAQRQHLDRTVGKARAVGEDGARRALEMLAVDRHEPYSSMTPEQRALRQRLRAHGRQVGDQRDRLRGTQNVDLLTHETAYEHWHRMLFARFLAENGLLVEPSSGVPVTLAECEDLARDRGEDTWALAGRFAQRMLPQVFRSDDPVLQVTLPPETRQGLEKLLGDLPPEVFLADDALGWTYQFWQSAEKDRVNSRVKSGEKVSGRTLPALTQLFTDDYMVLFLLHNTLGAWHGGRLLGNHPEVARAATSEQELRDAVALPHYTFDYLRFVRTPADGNGEGPAVEAGSWQPAAGTFAAWPSTARDLRVLDPCCGSGHFLVAAFQVLVRLRQAEEGLDSERAIQSVLAENLFGLELDARCTQIAAFNLALAAWRMAGRVVRLPELNIACTGLAPGASKSEWLELAGDDVRVSMAMDRLYSLFQQAPELGSLIDPGRMLAKGELWSAEFSQVQPLLHTALQRAEVISSDERHELGVAAQGMSKAAEILGSHYHLVITNVPYLKRGKQSETLKAFSATYHPDAKNDLATVFLERCLAFCGEGGTATMVLPQNWLFLTTYRQFREHLLKRASWHVLARLGPGAFTTVTGEVVKAILLGISHGKLGSATSGNTFASLDASAPRAPQEKAPLLGTAEVRRLDQVAQLANPDARIMDFDEPAAGWLSDYADYGKGSTTGDAPRFLHCFWEQPRLEAPYIRWLDSPTPGDVWSGRSLVCIAPLDAPQLKAQLGCRLHGQEVWGRTGVAVNKMSRLEPFLYLGEVFDDNVCPICPRDQEHLLAVCAYVQSSQFHDDIRGVDQALKVTAATLTKVPFEPDQWQDVATARYPEGLPQPYTNDPTQWLFHGHPAKTNDALQVAVARLVGYRWPAEIDTEMTLSPEARDLASRCDALLPCADDDGIACLPAVRGESTAADRVRRLLRAALGGEWSAAKEQELLHNAAGSRRPPTSLDEWLRDRFFEEHCALFQHRPFIWHIWDGRKDGFHALVNYHRLVGADGEGRRTLQALAYAYLGDWIDRQKAEQREGEEGADARVAAALDLQEQLQRILEGEPPYDLFVRWKPLHQQAIGWEPDVNDGVRINIRPFLSASLRTGGRTGAGLFRWKPKIDWGKDRGREPDGLRPQADYPWFWGCDPEAHSDHRVDFLGGAAFDGQRWNDLHYTNATRQAARDAAVEGRSS